jgi:subfamily B ATP-binding cassette protein MsbA
VSTAPAKDTSAPARALRLVELLRPERGRIAAAALCMIGLAAATALYAWLCGPLLKFLFLGAETPLLPEELLRVLRLLRPGLELTARRETLRFALPALLVGAALVKGLCDLGQRTIMGAVGLRLVARLRARIFDRLLAQPPAFLADRREGDLLALLVGDVVRVEEAATALAEAVLRDSVQVVVLAGMVVWLDPALALVTALVVPLAGVTLGGVGRAVRRAALAGQHALGDLAATAGESLRNLRAVKSLGGEAHAAARVAAVSDGYTARALGALRWRAVGPALMELLGGAGLAAVIGWATARIAAGTLAPEAFVSLFAGVLLLYQPVKSLTRVHAATQAGAAALDRIAPLFDAPGEPPDRPGARPPTGAEHGAVALAWDAVRLARGGRPVLRGVHLALQPGEIVALVGASGAGKTTMVDLALRLLEPDSGTVRLAGHDVAGLPRAWLRRRVAVVPQEPLLLRGTIAFNVAYPDEHPDRARVEAAARAAGVESFAAGLDTGLDTLVGEGGATLSGGERQRVAVARALYRDAGVLLLDEATSALDAAAEEGIRRTLRGLAGRCTLLVVAHRLSTARVADRIAVLHEGAIHEEGTPDDLAARGGLYAGLAALQEGGAAFQKAP